VTETNRFDEAWEAWRRDLTDAFTPASNTGLSARMWQALRAVGAVDSTDECIRRDWGMGLMTGEERWLAPLRTAGLDESAIHALITVIQRHPIPAAGG
jgi:hypothetical protein